MHAYVCVNMQSSLFSLKRIYFVSGFPAPVLVYSRFWNVNNLMHEQYELAETLTYTRK